jgi:glycosyltransferase involved in cell wall biosynthesis
MALVSVVIPAYNAAAYLGETLRSVQAQTYRNIEILVVDDGSTDDTAAVAARFGVRSLTQPNQGQAAARNAGIRAANGRYIALLDADDLWEPEKLQLQVALLEQTGLAWAYCDGYEFASDTGQTSYQFSGVYTLHAGDILRPLLLVNCIVAATPLIRRDVFDAVGGFDEAPLLRRREDWDMWLRIAARYPVGVVARPLVRYRVREQGNEAAYSRATYFVSNLTVIERAVARNPERLADVRNRAIAALCIRTGNSLVTQGSLRAARALYRQALRLEPRSWKAYVYWMLCLTGNPTLRRIRWLGKRFRYRTLIKY